MGGQTSPHVSSDAMAPDQSPEATLRGPMGGPAGEKEEDEEEAAVRGGYLHAGWRAMHQKMTAIPFFLKQEQEGEKTCWQWPNFNHSSK